MPHTSRDRRRRPRGVLPHGTPRIPIISRFYGIEIRMYFDDHAPPHFHARYGSSEASIRISDLTVLDGRLPPRASKLVREWADRHRDDLAENWRRAHRGDPLLPIAPLDWNVHMESEPPATVASITLGEGRVVRLRFSDGFERTLDLTPLMHGPVFEPMATDIEEFREVRVDPDAHTIVWPNGADICPDVLRYDRPPAWMEDEDR